MDSYLIEVGEIKKQINFKGKISDLKKSKEIIDFCIDNQRIVKIAHPSQLNMNYFDYYFNHLDEDSHNRLNQAIVESLQKELKIKGLLPIEYVFHKGLYRKEHLFYPMPEGLSDEELKILGEMVHSVVGG